MDTPQLQEKPWFNTVFLIPTWAVLTIIIFYYTDIDPMTQYIISYHCETKQKIITLQGKKTICICHHKVAAQYCREGWWDERAQCRPSVSFSQRRFSSLRWSHKKESTLSSGTSHLWTRDTSTEVNEDPGDNEKCQSWKCCAFETIITLESSFLKLYLQYTWRKKGI